MLTELEVVAARFPDRPAVVTEDAHLGYADLIEGADRFAGWLGAAGLGPEDVVGLTIREPLQHVVASLGLMRLGCVQVMLPSHEPSVLREEIAHRCGVSAIVALTPAAVPAPFHGLYPDFDAILGHSARPAARFGPTDPDRVSIVLASSGTTGRPKLVPLSQRQILVQSSNGRGPSGPETIYRPVSIEYNNAKRQSLYGLCLGATSVAVDPSRWTTPEVCRRYAVDSLMCSPNQAQSMLDSVKGDGPALPAKTRLYLSGSAIRLDLCAEARRRLTSHTYSVYGITECARVAIADPGFVDRLPGSVGRVLPDVAVAIVDDADRPLDAGEPGRVRVRTPGMATHYLDDPDMSARVFRDGWFDTGDIGHFAPDGQLVLLGRADDRMNLNSIKLFPGEIERIVEAYPGVVECAAFPLRSPVHGDIPVVAVRVGEGFDIAALHGHCRERLGVRAPRRIVKVDGLPRNAMDKIDRRALSAWLANGGDRR